MKKQNLFTLVVFLGFSVLTFAQQQYYDVTPGHGNGLRFWSNDNYKIHMGSTSNYTYGPVTTYSIKMNMNDDASRGWTWGVADQNPIAALNTQGTMQLAKDLRVMGKIGIGTNNPALPLEIYSSEFNHLRFNRSNSYAIDVKMGSSHHLVFQGVYGDPFFQFRNVAGDTKIQLHTNGDSYFMGGKIGISTISPDEKLHVKGNIKSSSLGSGEKNYLFFEESSGGTGAALLYDGYDNKLHIVGGTGDDPLSFAKHFTITRDEGNIGIGTVSPDYKLDVSGTIRACEVKVDLNSGECPDYVFSGDYNLMTLETLEQFVNENNHLPGIKPAKEMEPEGMDLKAINIQITKNRRNITLYDRYK